jgi:hypothetical protein
MSALMKRSFRASAGVASALCLLTALPGCAPGASNVAIERPSHPLNVECSGSHSYDARAVLGLSEREAKTIVARWGCALRVTELDGSSLAASAGADPRRVNVEVKDGLVVRIAKIG